jgi:hypothetical protein
MTQVASTLTEACTGYRRYPVRESRYPMLLRGKNATGRTDGKTEKASIGELRRSLIDTLTKERQVAIESAIILRDAVPHGPWWHHA